MGSSARLIVQEYKSRITDKQFAIRRREEGVMSHTSLLALLYNKGALVYSDLQATAYERHRASSRETKVYSISDDGIVLAGTGAISGIKYVAEKARILLQVWKSRNDGRLVPPQEAGDLISGIVDSNPGLDSAFLMGGYDHDRDRPLIASIDDGCIMQSNLFESLGSGSLYVYPRGEVLSRKVLSRLPQEKRERVVVSQDIYDALDQLEFPLETALPLGLDAIASGPQCDVFSGGEGFQVMRVDRGGVAEYILSKENAQKALAILHAQEYAAVLPRKKGEKQKGKKQKVEKDALPGLEGLMEIFEKCRRR
ncbi:hypothetical protein HY772_00690 [Candidatus Woesearchaeota archaeon]|nr:hypothetical protein [Candidatus Woesearchaeota archaeon]